MSPITIDGLTYFPDTGIFVFASGPRQGKRAGSLHKHGHRHIRFGSRFRPKEHRLAWFFVHGKWPSAQIDHINCDPSDNRLINLRLATCAQNCANQRTAKNNTSGVKGVSWSRAANKWKAEIRVNRKAIYLGCFVTIEQASQALADARAEWVGEFARAA